MDFKNEIKPDGTIKNSALSEREIEVFQEAADIILNKCKAILEDYLHDFQPLFHQLTPRQSLRVRVEKYRYFTGFWVGISDYSDYEKNNRIHHICLADFHWCFSDLEKSTYGRLYLEDYKVPEKNLFDFIEIGEYLSLKRLSSYCQETLKWDNRFNCIIPPPSYNSHS